jgi:hypothetical protein
MRYNRPATPLVHFDVAAWLVSHLPSFELNGGMS